MAYQLQRKIDNNNDCMWSVAWTQGNLVSGSLEGVVKVWNAKSAEVICQSEKFPVGITSLLVLQDGSAAIACYQDSVIRFFDLIDKRFTQEIDPGVLEAYSLSLSPQEDIIVSGNAKGGINVWSMEESHEKVTTIQTDITSMILSTNFSVDSKLISSGMDGLVNVIDMSTQQTLYKIEDHAMPVRSVCFSPDGDLFYAAAEDRELTIYDIRTGKCVQTFCNNAMALCVDPSPNSRHVSVGSTDGKVTVWDLGMRKRLQKLENHNDAVWSVSFDKNDLSGSRFASTGDDGTLCIYERKS